MVCDKLDGFNEYIAIRDTKQNQTDLEKLPQFYWKVFKNKAISGKKSYFYILNKNRNCDSAITDKHRMSVRHDKEYTQETCNSLCFKTKGCRATAFFSHFSKGRCDLYKEACPPNRYNQHIDGMVTSVLGKRKLVLNKTFNECQKLC